VGAGPRRAYCDAGIDEVRLVRPLQNGHNLARLSSSMAEAYSLTS
jgi:hypothetical protein